MRKELSTGFESRQYMQEEDFEIFYYKDVSQTHVHSHTHSHYEFYFFLEGAVTYQVGKTSYPLRFGDFLLIPPDICHHPSFDSPEQPYRRFVLWISARHYHQLVKACPDFSYAFDYIQKSSHYHFRPDYIQAQALHGQLLELIEEKHGNRAFRNLSAQLMVCSLLLSFNRIVDGFFHQVPATSSNHLYLDVCDYINSHLEENLSLDQLAAFFYVSKYHIAHIFKEHMGISLHQYVLKKRLQACKNGILSGIPLGSLFFQFGFHDYSSFYRAFKKEFGISPSAFKKEHSLSDSSHP